MSDILWLPSISLIILSSLLVWTQFIANWRAGQNAVPYRDRAPAKIELSVVIGSVLLWLLTREVAVDLIGKRGELTIANVQATCAAGAVSVLLVLAILFRPSLYHLKDIGLRFPDSAEEFRYGFFGFIACVVPVTLVLIATYPLRNESNQHKLLQLLRAETSIESIVWITLAVVLIAPAIEELIFRVVMQGTMVPRIGKNPAILATAAMFSMIHGWPDMLPLFPLAIILGYLFHQRNSYVGVVLLHGLFNLCNLVLTLLAPVQ